MSWRSGAASVNAGNTSSTLLPVPGNVAVAYEQTTLPAYFFRCPTQSPGERRPLVIINNGSDGATSQMVVHGGAAAGERGYHWMTFDGPGQQSALYEQAIPFRPDWETVLTPVLDAMLERPDVDAERIAIIGISQAGSLGDPPRARVRAPRRCRRRQPGRHRRLDRMATAIAQRDAPNSYMRPAQDAFDREMRLAELFSPATAATLRSRGKPYGLAGDSPFALYETVLAYRLGDELDQITTPLLVTDPEDEQVWPGQSQQLYDRLLGTSELLRFTSRGRQPPRRATRPRPARRPHLRLARHLSQVICALRSTAPRAQPLNVNRQRRQQTSSLRR